MPTLTWPSKKLPGYEPADLATDSVIYPQGLGFPGTAAEDRLLLGDNLRTMASLLPEYEGRLDLIYADPPFFTNKQFSTRIGRGEDSRQPQDWQMVEGYGDSWENLDEYLDFLYPRLALMVRLLSPRGTLYLHLDWHANSYARLLLDELFGRERLLNEIIWTYHGPSPIRRAFNRKHDTILAYVKGDDHIFNADAVRQAYHPSTVKTFASSSRAGFGKVPDLARGKVPEDWWYFPVVARMHSERTGYPTQKPEALLERILLASSNPGSIVGDFFCGSGTFPLNAARHDRHYLAGDSSWRAIHTARARLVEAARMPLKIQREAGIIIPTTSGQLNFNHSGQFVTLMNPPELDYWEIDPDWAGNVFHSVMQAKRPNRSSEILLKIKMPVALKNICIRAITVDGSMIQSNVQPVANSPDRF
jgi:site-specific DNA-methyltransferase (adenine-specific)